MRRAALLLSRVSGGLLVFAGAYVAWYGWYEIRVLGGGSTRHRVVDGAATVRRWLSDLLNEAGAAVLAAILAVL